MGDTAVDVFLETLKQLIRSPQLDSFREAKHQLQALEEEVKYLRGFLKVTEKKRNEHSEVMKLVMQIRDLVYEAENIIEGILIDALKGKHLSLDPLEEDFQVAQALSLPPDQDFRIIHKNKLKSFTHLLCCFNSERVEEVEPAVEVNEHVEEVEPVVQRKFLFIQLESVKEEMESITTEVKQIYEQNIYDIKGITEKKHSSARSGGGSSSTGDCNTSKVVKEKVVVGFDKEVERLIERLDYRGEGREIVTIIGPGGSGKTTLAREVYDHSFTLCTFEIRAWVDVSQDYDKTTMKRDLLIRVLKSAFPENQEDYEKRTEDMLGEKLLRYLKGRKYLIVMDDVWGIEAWNDIQRSFPNECNGSKVMFTSRQLVQLDSVCFIPHYLDPLTKRHSWELLQKKVFGMNCCPPELVDIGVKIAEKCEGLPLAIVAIAGILSTEDKTLDVWEEVAINLSSIIAKNKKAGCMEILELSYNHLPLYLKACFLYIGAFLEDSEIRVRELLWLWIAEGFIKQSEEGKSLEAVARDHLINLIDRSLIMVARKSSLGGIKACRIHDLLRLFCLKKAEEDNFFVQIHRNDSFSPSATNKARRLFIAHRFFNMSDDSDHPRNFHSFLCLLSPNSWDSSFKRMWMSFFDRNFGHLRVISFISAEFEVDIQRGGLVHLRYLATRIPSKCHSRDLPVPISNLLNLETLDLKVEKPSDSIQLPWDIFKMGKLRHLYCKNGVFMYHFDFEEAAQVGFDNSSKLDSLQTLHQICACKDCQNFLVRTPNLRKLGLAKNIDLRDDETLDLEFLKCLETLSLSLLIPMARMMFPLIVEPRARMKLPLTVKRLTLRSTSLKWEELSIFQNLPSLEVLKLGYGACIGPVWNTSGEGFPQLKYLRLSHMYEIEKWSADEDQFPRLEDLVLEDCSKLERIPIDFANLNELREIKVTGCTRTLEESAREIREEQKYRKGDDDCPNLIVKHNFWDSSDESE